jgi:hypothetical protein
MRVSTLPFILGLLLAAPASAQNVPDTTDENLVGLVRSVEAQTAHYEEGEEEGKGSVRQLDIVAYDTKGNEVGRTIYDDYGYLAGNEVVTRDTDGHRTGSVLTDPKGKVLERKAYLYAGGRLAEVVERDGKGKVVVRQVSTYAPDGRVREITYHDGARAVGKTVYRYDAQGRGSEEAYYLADGSEAIAPIGPCLGAHRKTYAYDEKGRPARVAAYELGERPKNVWQYSYNPRGTWRERCARTAGPRRPQPTPTNMIRTATGSSGSPP